VRGEDRVRVLREQPRGPQRRRQVVSRALQLRREAAVQQDGPGGEGVREGGRPAQERTSSVRSSWAPSARVIS